MKKWLVGGYLLAFIGGIIWFWVASDNLDALGFCLLYFFILLPVATILVSFFIGKNNIFGKGKWLAAAVFGLLYMLSEYATMMIMVIGMITRVLVNFTVTALSNVDAPR